MIRPRRLTRSHRRGIILLVVLAFLTLFAVVGLSFVLYADAEATSSRIYRESEDFVPPDPDPRPFFAYFLGQVNYDVSDDDTGVYSALRGHSLLRSIYGMNDQGGNYSPFSGTGRLHASSPFPGVDDYQLINYTFFSGDNILRDPERLGTRKTADPAKLDERGLYTGGFNVPYTYPDVNNMFLAAVRASDGRVLAPSFHRPSLAR